MAREIVCGRSRRPNIDPDYLWPSVRPFVGCHSFDWLSSAKVCLLPADSTILNYSGTTDESAECGTGIVSRTTGRRMAVYVKLLRVEIASNKWMDVCNLAF